MLAEVKILPVDHLNLILSQSKGASICQTLEDDKLLDYSLNATEIVSAELA